MDESVSKEAMDAAIKAAVTTVKQEQADLREAERFVRPLIGDLAVAFNTAADFYKAALEQRGVKIDPRIPTSAYRPMLEALPVLEDQARVVAGHVRQEALGEVVPLLEVEGAELAVLELLDQLDVFLGHAGSLEQVLFRGR